jgi:hypothetical protein
MRGQRQQKSLLFDAVFFLPETTSIHLQLEGTFLPIFHGLDQASEVQKGVCFLFRETNPLSFSRTTNRQWATSSGWEASPVIGSEMLRLCNGRREQRQQAAPITLT